MTVRGKFIALASVFFAGNLLAQSLDKSRVPAPVMATFAKAYPKANHVKWEKEANAYEASFRLSTQKRSAVFSVAGKQTEAELTIPVSKLPEAVLSYMKQQQKTIREAAEITDANGRKYFEAEAGGKDYFFDVQGKPVKKIGD